MDSKLFLKNGYILERNFLIEKECKVLLAVIEDYRKQNDIPEIFRKVNGRSLHYKVIDGIAINKSLPEIYNIYLRVKKISSQLNGEQLYPLSSEKVGVNINITPPKGEYRWHYDRNRLTAILYLNEVAGGETEFYPNYRIFTKHKKLQKWVDKLLFYAPIRFIFGKRLSVKPEVGALLIMLGNQCLHSVRSVTGDKERINIIMAYDEKDKEFSNKEKLDAYLYEDTKKLQFDSDPNYG